MSDPQQLCRLSQAVEIIERITGEKPHAATIHRWVTRGLAGVRLKAIYAGGYRRTSEAWICEFFENVTNAKNLGHPVAPATTSSTRRRRIEEAEKALKDAGI